MTLKQWWVHFKAWLFDFPIPRHSDHFWVGYAGDNRSLCLLCKAVHTDDDIDEDLEHAMELKKILD